MSSTEYCHEKKTYIEVKSDWWDHIDFSQVSRMINDDNEDHNDKVETLIMFVAMNMVMNVDWDIEGIIEKINLIGLTSDKKLVDSVKLKMAELLTNKIES